MGEVQEDDLGLVAPDAAAAWREESQRERDYQQRDRALALAVQQGVHDIPMMVVERAKAYYAFLRGADDETESR